MAKVKTETAIGCIMLLDDLIRAGELGEAEAYRMLKKHVFKIKSPFLGIVPVYPPFSRQKKH